MTIDTRLLSLLVCPLCKGSLQLARSAEGRASELCCLADRLGFPIRDGIPVMLEGEARTLSDDEVDAMRPAAPRPPSR